MTDTCSKCGRGTRSYRMVDGRIVCQECTSDAAAGCGECMQECFCSQELVECDIPCDLCSPDCPCQGVW